MYRGAGSLSRGGYSSVYLCICVHLKFSSVRLYGMRSRYLETVVDIHGFICVFVYLCVFDIFYSKVVWYEEQVA